ncbi:MAG: type I DNA topoisomerase [Paracoccaceae bacterium]
MAVVVVESPAKAKTINKYLGNNYTVLATFGHVRDLDDKSGSVDPNNDFSLKWQVNSKSQPHLKAIKQALSKDNHLILATDPDREGEAISWHLVEILKNQKSLKDNTRVERVVFNAITRTAILEAIKKPRDLDIPLIEAYLARRALDYLLGYTVSPSLRKVGFGFQPAGRVQSPTLRLIVEREMEIESFKAAEYWSIEGKLNSSDGKLFEAHATQYKGEKLEKYSIKSQSRAHEIVDEFSNCIFHIESISSTPKKRSPFPPFLTSTLQQEANSRLYMGTSQTMSVAQKLYEAGHITYMRTDGIDMAPEAISATRSVIQDSFGNEYLPEKPRFYKNKVVNAQEAHECIRPTNIRNNTKNLNLTDLNQSKLYELIRNRTLASQMENEVSETTTVTLTSGQSANKLRASGRVIIFDGFRRVFNHQETEDQKSADENELPLLTEGSKIDIKSLTPNQHFTQPKPRYSEATLVKKMEDLGIGRPSTYAPTISKIQAVKYVRKEKNRLIPEDKGKLISIFLTEYFQKYVSYDFTAELEKDLDYVSSGQSIWLEILHKFWTDFSPILDAANELRISTVLDRINDILEPHIFPQEGTKVDPRICRSCNEGKLSIRTARNGSAFIGCSNFPNCKFVKPLSIMTEETLSISSEENTLGKNDAGVDIYLRSGRFGPYIQLGELSEENPKPKRTSIPKNFDADNMNLKLALQLIELPKILGKHPDDGEPIQSAIGPYGPYLKHNNSYANIANLEEFLSIGMNRAVELIAEQASKKSKSRSSSVIRKIGDHPDGGEIQLMTGRYGPYLKHKKTNVGIKDKSNLDTIDIDKALELLKSKSKK